MSENKRLPFADRGSRADVEHGLAFMPAFDAEGLLPAIVSDRRTGDVLMFAFMSAEALRLSIETGEAHFWSRSRRRIWKKGEESGNVLRVAEMRTDCDQDAVLLIVDVEGDGVACHTGERSCFYRAVAIGEPGSDALALTLIDTAAENAQSK
jgi:phosphoribosyl-AMP cyclohydrolase